MPFSVNFAWRLENEGLAGLKKWTNCATSCEWGTLYLETYTGEPEQVFVNVCSQAGVKHVGGFFEIELEDSKPKYGWRMGLENYLDSEVFVDKKP